MIAQTRFGRLLEGTLYAFTLVALILVLGVQLGIARGRALAAREARTVVSPSFADTSCTNALGTLRLQVVATGYSSEVAQTDSTPFITASGTRVHAGTIALSPDLRQLLPYGSTVLVVEDSTHPRLRRTVDIWYPDRRSALRWGRRTLTLELER